ncbi:MAG: hypothetical protein ACI4RO_04675, partial [Candidatus Scatosoma sp.]
EFDISYQAKDGITLSPGDFDFATDTNEYTAVYEKSLICGNGFAQGSTVYVKVYSKDEVKVAKTLTLSGGGNEFNVEGTYFADEDATVFEFVYDKAYAATVTLATRIRISGKVNVPDGVDASSVQVETSDGNVYHGAVNANGEFNLLLLAGTYDFRFSASEYAAYLLGYTVDGESAPLNVTLVSAICELGSTGTVNGNKVNAEGTTVNDFAFRADSMDGSVSDLGDGKIYLLPNTATSEDFVFSVTMTQINRFAGMGITDGKMNLSFQVVSWEKDGRNLIMELSTWMSETIVEIVIPVNPNTIDEATYTIAKTGETITLYAGTGDKTVWLAILTPDGILLNGGSLIERSANGKTSAQRFAIQELYLNSFLVQGKEYMAMLIRNEVVLTGSSVTKAAYEYSFTKGSGNVQVFLEVPAGVNAINGTATFRTDKTAYTFDVTSSEFTVNLPYGVYEYEVEVSGYAVGNGKGTLTLDGNATIDNMVLIERAVGPELYVTEETADSITLSWMENAQHESYQIMRVVGSGNATATTVLADSAEGAFAATDGWFVYKIEGDAFVSGAKYVVVTTPRAGYVAPENVAVTATPYSKGVLFDASVDEMMTRVAVSGDGVDVSYDGGIKLQGDGEKTVRVNINRSFDLSGVNYLSVQVS